MNKFVLLNLGSGTVTQGFDDITVQVWSDTSTGPSNQYRGCLPPNPQLVDCYRRWQELYRYSWPQDSSRMIIKDDGISHFSISEFRELCCQLEKLINIWFSTTDFFVSVVQSLQQDLSPEDEIQVILESSEDDLVRRLPLHLWQFFQEFPKAELVISEREWRKIAPSQTPPGIVRILAVFGDKTDLNLGDERKFLSELDGAEVCFLDEPEKQQLLQFLKHEYWDILFFAGHSWTQNQIGWIHLNSKYSLSINELKQELNIAIENGLQLAIFNSCDGLGIAQQLGKLNIPHVIVMREQVLDHLAQKFLRHLLEYLSIGLSLYLAVKNARKILFGLENFPCAGWLPVILQNPSTTSPTWKTLRFDRRDQAICPYQGLSYFDCNNKDPQYFYGRHTLINQLLKKIQDSNFIALVGASGSGKSSVLRAGLVHQLQLGKDNASNQNWKIKIIEPGENPLNTLISACDTKRFNNRKLKSNDIVVNSDTASNRLISLFETYDNTSTVLVIDQFEEVFTLCQNKLNRKEFFKSLTKLIIGSEKKISLVLALRADFLGKFFENEYYGFSQKIKENIITIHPLNRNELEEAIILPAQKLGLQVEAELVKQVIEDVVSAPASLPLMQYTLTKLWERREDKILSLKNYKVLGGVNASLQQQITTTYENLSQEQKKVTKHIFMALTHLGEGTEDTRRRISYDSLISKEYPKELIDTTVKILTDAYLIVTNHISSEEDHKKTITTIDVAHETIIRHWPLLRVWIDENREKLKVHRKLESNAIFWQEEDRISGYLLQGYSLAKAVQFYNENKSSLPLSDLAKKFIRISQRHEKIRRFINFSWLILPILIGIPFLENHFRDAQIISDYASLDEVATYKERQAIQRLIRGCPHVRNDYYYLDILLYGNCLTLTAAPLKHANLNGIIFKNVDLSYADLSGADLSGSILSNVNLSGAVLTGIDLSDATLYKVNLSHANLSGGNLSNTQITDSKFVGTNLEKTNLRIAILRHLDFRETTGLVKSQVIGVDHPIVCRTIFLASMNIEYNRDCSQLNSLK